MTQGPLVTSPEYHVPMQSGDPYYRVGRHAEDDAYIWGGEEVDLTFVIEQAWADGDVETLRKLADAEGLDGRFREYAENRLGLVAKSYVQLYGAAGRVAKDMIAQVTAAAPVADNPTVVILPWPEA